MIETLTCQTRTSSHKAGFFCRALATLLIAAVFFAAATLLLPGHAMAKVTTFTVSDTVMYTYDDVENSLAIFRSDHLSEDDDATFTAGDWDTLRHSDRYIGDVNCQNLKSIVFVDPVKIVGDKEELAHARDMFSGLSNLETLDMRKLDTSEVTDMSYMFSGCAKLETIDVSGFDTSKVTSMAHMFKDCSSVTQLKLDGFDTSNVTDMSFMFCTCSRLDSLNLASFDTSKVVNMNEMFANCPALCSLDLSNFTIAPGVSMTSMFAGTDTGRFTCDDVITAAMINSNVGSSIRLPDGDLAYNAQDNTLHVTKDVTIQKPAKLPEGVSLNVYKNATLTIAHDATFENNGDVVNNGKISIASGARVNNNGTLQNEGDIANNGTFDTSKGDVSGPGSLSGSSAVVKKGQEAPDAPVLAGKTSNSIEVAAPQGSLGAIEFSIDGANWGTATKFGGLKGGVVYSVYARYAETNYLSASPASAPLKVDFTEGGQKPPASAPELVSATADSITVKAVVGCEYSADNGVTWQASNVFSGLSASTSYTIIARYAETDTAVASLAGPALTASTLAVVIPGNGKEDGGDLDSPKANKLTKATLKFSVKAKTLNKAKKKVFKTSPKVASGKAVTSQITGGGNKAAKKYKKLFSIAKKTGKITVKKGLPKGTYKLKVKFSSAKTAKYKAFSITKTVTITVK